MEDGFLGVSWLMGGVACLVVAGIYTVVWPRAQVAAARSSWNRIVLRWFHGLVWLLLSGSFFVRGTLSPGGQGIAGFLALSALVCYGIFMFTLIRARRRLR
jgi:hypothetical protein